LKSCKIPETTKTMKTSSGSPQKNDEQQTGESFEVSGAASLQGNVTCPAAICKQKIGAASAQQLH